MLLNGCDGTFLVRMRTRSAIATRSDLVRPNGSISRCNLHCEIYSLQSKLNLFLFPIARRAGTLLVALFIGRCQNGPHAWTSVGTYENHNIWISSLNLKARIQCKSQKKKSWEIKLLTIFGLNFNGESNPHRWSFRFWGAFARCCRYWNSANWSKRLQNDCNHLISLSFLALCVWNELSVDCVSDCDLPFRL